MDNGKVAPEKRTGYLLKTTSAGKDAFDHVVIMEEGIHKVHVAKTQMTPPLLFFKLPLNLNAGEKWEVNSTSGNATVKGTYTAKVDKIEVPIFGKKTVSAVLVSFTDHQHVKVDTWFVEKVGMVKQRVQTKDHGVELELEKFEGPKAEK
jgi:hypothetical protein